MSYIKREKALSAINNLPSVGGCSSIDRDDAVNAIENIHAADVVEVVRCKDCVNSKHWYADRRRCFLWHETGIGVFENDF